MTGVVKRVNAATGPMRRWAQSMNRAKRMEHLYRRSRHFALPWPLRWSARVQLWWLERDPSPWILPLLIGLPLGALLVWWLL